MDGFLTIAKALGDETRLRVLMMLGPGELCLCQLISVLGSSPSTVSKHVSLLHAAGLVTFRKEGRWRYYQLAGRGARPEVKQALKWVRDNLKDEARIERDREACCDIAGQPLESVSCCYR